MPQPYQENNLEQLKLSNFYLELFNKSLHPIAFLDREEHVLDINEEFEKVFGYSREEMLGKSINDFIVPEELKGEADQFMGIVTHSKTHFSNTLRRSKSGELIEVEAVGSPIILEGEFIGLYAMYRDRRVEEKALKDLRRERAYFRQLFENSPDSIALLDDRDRIIDFNKSFEKLFGYKLEEVRGACIDEIIAGEGYVQEVQEFARALINEGKTIKTETVRTTKVGRNVEVELLAYPIYLDEDRLGAYAFYRDISDRKNKEREIRELIYRDSLTGVYNRKYAYENLDKKLHKAKKEKGIVSFLYFDLESFKKVNDARGHSFGDLLLIKIAERISTYFAGQMELCRVGGDEFMAIVNDPYVSPMHFYIDQLEKLFKKDFVVNGEKIKSGLSIGYATYPKDGTDLDHLIYTADSRMYREKRIKRIRKNPFRKDITVEELMEDYD